MSHDVTMPQLGMAQDAGKIVSWLKAEGDAVTKGDALFEVETDKAVMEVEAQAAGFLTGVSAAEGTDVPVGQVIAQISDSADAPAPAKPEAEATDSPPNGTRITMPQLGMAQDSGLLLSWHKSPGDAVAADDVLFEVETDKSTMDVPAGASGYLAATLAEPGEEVPVGEPVAIISAEIPDSPVARKSAGSPITVTAPTPTPEPAKTAPKPIPHPAGGPILASPKARRLARERGLDLALLAEAGHPQPFHVADLEVLAAMPAKGATPAAAAATQHLTASIAHDGFAEFADWAADIDDLTDPDALLAGLVGASLPRDTPVTIAISRHGTTRSYTVPMSSGLSHVAETDAPPDLTLRDLRGTALRSAILGPQPTPTLTLLSSETTALTLTLECSPAQLSPEAAIHTLAQFAARMEQPLHHLL